MNNENELFTIREQIRAYEHELGLYGYSETEKSIYAFILYKDGTAFINSIVLEPYFKNNSLSTIKRATSLLEKNSLISRVFNKHTDKRHVLLKAIYGS